MVLVLSSFYLPTGAFAETSPYWLSDEWALPSTSWSGARSDFEGTAWHRLSDSCLWEVSHLATTWLTARGGGSCKLTDDNFGFLSATLFPEVGILGYPNPFRPQETKLSLLRPRLGLTFGVSGSSRLPGTADVVVFGRFQYKWAPRFSLEESVKRSVPNYNTFLIAAWMDAFETYMEGGAIFGTVDQENKWRFRLSYQEMLARSFRRLGGLIDSAALNYKVLRFEARRSYQPLILGLGGGYFILELEALRIAFPYPIFYLAYEW